MISNFNYYRQVESPTMYLCNPDGRFLYAIEASNRILTLRFNDLSEITFTVNSAHIDKIAYGLIERRRLIFLDNIGWFQIGAVTEDTSGDVSTKNVTAYSSQIVLQERNLMTEDRVYTFINTNDLEDDQYDPGDPSAMPSVIGQLCKQAGVKLGNMVVAAEPPTITSDLGDWTIVWVTPSVRFNSQGIKDDETGYNGLYTPSSDDKNANPCRSFTENSDQNAYDFIINEVEKAFNIVFEFDFLHHAIYVRDFSEVNVPTDIFISFENVANTMAINEQTDDLVTVMEVNGDGLDITNVNPMGSNYVANFEYYMKEESEDGKVDYPWMSEGLVNTLRDWETHLKEAQEDESDDSYTQLMQKLYDQEKLTTETDEELVYANLKVSDLEVVVQQMQTDKENANDEELAKGQEYITAEEVENNKNSLYPKSNYYNSVFDADKASIEAYTKAPTLTTVTDGEGNKSYYFTFSGLGSPEEGTPNDLIVDFISSKEELAPLYFFDIADSKENQKKSFCKLTVSTEVQAVKDDGGKLSGAGMVTFENQTYDGKIGSMTFKVFGGKISNDPQPTFTYADGTGSESFSVGRDTESGNTTYYTIGGKRYGVLEGANSTSVRYFYVSGFTRYTMYSQIPGDGGWKALWESEQKRLKDKKEDTQSTIDDINTKLAQIAQGYDLADGETVDQNNPYRNYGCNVEYFVQRYDKDHGTHLYQELKHYWIEGEYSNENYAETEDMPFDERLSLSEELMVAAQEDLARAVKPKYETTIDAINFLRIKEFELFTEQLELGRLITIEKSDGNCFQPALMEISYNLDTADDFSMTFSTAMRPNSMSLTIADILKETSSVGKTVISNWSNLTDYYKNKDEITSLIENPLDNTLRAAIGNMVNQEFTIDTTGILGRKIESTKDADGNTIAEKFSPKQVRLINNMLIFTEDNWETASTALGEIKIDENTSAYGLIADVLVGNLIMGSNLKISNESNTITLDESGISIKAPNADGTAVETVFQANNAGNVVLKGTIYADSGEIGGLILTKGAISARNGFFSVNSNGELTAKRGTIGELTIAENGIGIKSKEGGFTLAFDKDGISSSNGLFRVDRDGNLTAQGADISGVITATSGEIGGFAIGSSALYNGINSMTTSGTGVYLGTDGLNLGGNFTVDGDGNTLIKKGAITLQTTTDNGGIIHNTFDENSIVIEYDFGDLNSYTSISPQGVFIMHTDDPSNDARNSFLRLGAIATEGYIENDSTICIRSAASGAFAQIRIDSSDDTTTLSGATLDLIAIREGHIVGGTWYRGEDPIDFSDEKIKNSIEEVDERYSLLFDNLKPVRYKYNAGTSDRFHTGLIAQDVKNAIVKAGLSTKDFAAYAEWKTDDCDKASCGIRYEELVSLCIAEIQKLKKQLQILTQE